MKIEVFDDHGKLVDTLPANSRRGISRVQWSMRMKAPRVPPAAVGRRSHGDRPPRAARHVHHQDDARHRNVHHHLDVELDRRATYTVADRKLELDAAMRVYALLGDLSYDVDRINGVHDALLERAAKLGANDPSAQAMHGPGREGG